MRCAIRGSTRFVMRGDARCITKSTIRPWARNTMRLWEAPSQGHTTPRLQARNDMRGSSGQWARNAMRLQKALLQGCDRHNKKWRERRHYEEHRGQEDNCSHALKKSCSHACTNATLTKEGIVIFERKYGVDILKETSMIDYGVMNSPINPS